MPSALHLGARGWFGVSCLVTVIVVVASPWVFLALDGPERVRTRYGPVHVWFSPWEGDVTIPSPGLPCRLVMRPARPHPNVVVVRVSSNEKDKSELRSDAGAWVRLPAESGKLCVFDWYGGDLPLEYVPEEVTGESVRVQWVFGYES